MTARRKRTDRQRAKDKCDDYFSQITRARGYCEAEGTAGRDCSPKLETCHIITRARSNTRCVDENVLCMCSSHHRFYTANPVEWGLFVIGRMGEDAYWRLYALSQEPSKVDWVALAGELKARLELVAS